MPANGRWDLTRHLKGSYSSEITLNGNVNIHNNMYWCSKNTYAVHQVHSHNLKCNTWCAASTHKTMLFKEKISIATVFKINTNIPILLKNNFKLHRFAICVTYNDCHQMMQINIMEGQITNKTTLFLTKYCHTEASLVDNVTFLYILLQRLFLWTVIMTETFGKTV